MAAIKNVHGWPQGHSVIGPIWELPRSQQKAPTKEAASILARHREAGQVSLCPSLETWKNPPAVCPLTCPFSPSFHLERGELRKEADGAASFAPAPSLGDRSNSHL